MLHVTQTQTFSKPYEFLPIIHRGYGTAPNSQLATVDGTKEHKCDPLHSKTGEKTYVNEKIKKGQQTQAKSHETCLQ